MKLIFVRHGQDDDRFRGGWSNLDLTPEGMQQSEQLAAHLKVNQSRYQISRILSSDLRRTMTTARFISEALGLPIQPEPQLREMNNGDLAGMPNAEALLQYPSLFFSALDMDEAYPNGENPRAFYERIRCWFDAFLRDHRNSPGNTLIVTHGGVINILYHLVKGAEWSNKNRPFPAAPCSIHVLDTETMTFEAENETSHLIG